MGNTGDTGEGSSGGEEPSLTGGIVAAYLGLVVIWSTTPLSVVLSLRDFDAVWSLGIRMLLAALLASAILKVMGLRLVLHRQALKLYAIGSISMFGAMLFTYLGARRLPSGMISVLFGLSPLVVGLLSRFFVPGTRFSVAQWLGLVVALAGLAVIFLEGGELSSVDTASVALVLAGVLSYGISALWMKKLPHALPPLVQTTGALWMSALGCALVLPVLGGPAPTHWPGGVTVAAILYSATMGSIVAMFCYFYLLQRITVGTMALTTLVTPVFALLLGMAINHERFHAEILWGMTMILAGLGAYYERDIRRMACRQRL